jgi:hypothetical protein
MDWLNKLDKNWILVFYKLLSDALFLVLIALGGLLVADGILPEFFDAYLSFTKIIIIIFFICGAIFYIHNYKKLPTSESSQSKKLIFVMTFFLLALIVNSLLKFNPWEVLIISTTTLLIVFYLFKVIFEKDINYRHH